MGLYYYYPVFYIVQPNAIKSIPIYIYIYDISSKNVVPPQKNVGLAHLVQKLWHRQWAAGMPTTYIIGRSKRIRM